MNSKLYVNSEIFNTIISDDVEKFKYLFEKEFSKNERPYIFYNNILLYATPRSYEISKFLLLKHYYLFSYYIFIDTTRQKIRNEIQENIPIIKDLSYMIIEYLL